MPPDANVLVKLPPQGPWPGSCEWPCQEDIRKCDACLGLPPGMLLSPCENAQRGLRGNERPHGETRPAFRAVSAGPVSGDLQLNVVK